MPEVVLHHLTALAAGEIQADIFESLALAATGLWCRERVPHYRAAWRVYRN
jgi:hypothetical protein